MPLLSSPPGDATEPGPLDASISSISSLDPRATHDIRQVILAFLPSGGIIDRLGESRETTRSIARDTLVQIGIAALRFGTGGSSGLRASKHEKSETPYTLYERFLRDVGFASKVWRVREQVRDLT